MANSLRVNMFIAKSSIRYFLILIVVFASAFAVEDTDIYGVRVESCRGCQLNRLPEVKEFIYKDVPEYENVEFKPIQGAPPELVFVNKDDEEISRVPLSRFTRLECNELLESKGFFKKEKVEKNEF